MALSILRRVLLTIVGSSLMMAPSHAQETDLAKKLNNPLASLISVPFQFNYDEGYGAGDGRKLFVNVQPVVPFKLSDDYNLVSRTVLPFVIDQEDIANPLSGHQTGFGDTVQSLWLSNSEPIPMGSLGSLVAGIGPVLLLPTGNADPLLGSGKWGAGVTPLAVFLNGPMVYGALVNHIWSFAGKDSRADVNSTYIQPFFSYTTPDAVTFSLNSESTYNWETNQWSIPVNFQISKLVNISGQPISLFAGARYWVESPTTGPDDFGLRFGMTFLFPEK